MLSRTVADALIAAHIPRPGAGLREVDDADAPGTARTLRARLRAMESPPLDFPRRFSRYSTLEASRATAMEASHPCKASSGEEGSGIPEEEPTRYLMLCRVAMGRTERAPAGGNSESLASFADEDSQVGTLVFPDEVMATERTMSCGLMPNAISLCFGVPPDRRSSSCDIRRRSSRSSSFK